MRGESGTWEGACLSGSANRGVGNVLSKPEIIAVEICQLTSCLNPIHVARFNSGWQLLRSPSTRVVLRRYESTNYLPSLEFGRTLCVHVRPDFYKPFFSRSCSLLFKQNSREFAQCAKTRKPPRRFPIGHAKHRRPRILLRCWQKPLLSTRFLNECVTDPSTAQRWCARFFRLLKKAPNPIPRRNPNFAWELRQRSTFCPNQIAGHKLHCRADIEPPRKLPYVGTCARRRRPGTCTRPFLLETPALAR